MPHTDLVRRLLHARTLARDPTVFVPWNRLRFIIVVFIVQIGIAKGRQGRGCFICGSSIWDGMVRQGSVWEDMIGLIDGA